MLVVSQEVWEEQPSPFCSHILVIQDMQAWIDRVTPIGRQQNGDCTEGTAEDIQPASTATGVPARQPVTSPATHRLMQVPGSLARPIHSPREGGSHELTPATAW